MNSIRQEQVLRLNCPGFGEESYLTVGKAKPLDQYDVIVANPVSILHLFDRDPELLKEVNSKIDEGLTSFSLPNDQLLLALESDLKKRIFELVSFLEKGGLLIYYLCRPFLLQSVQTDSSNPSSGFSMDNYFWLESLAPDTPVENNVRHMSAVSHGRTIEPTDHAERSEFAEYFKQQSLEWNTIIRNDFLTEGYIVLATAGPRKCIAAHLMAGDNGGRIIFLPAPYSPDFDRTLMDCVNNWYSKHRGSSVAQHPGTSDFSAAPLFPQPNPQHFLKPESMSKPEPLVSQSRASESQPKIGLPPLQKFDTRSSRTTIPAMNAVEESATKELTARDILDTVSDQADRGLGPPSQNALDADIDEAFNKLLGPSAEQNLAHTPKGVPSPTDLLKQLESLGPGAGSPPPASSSPDASSPPLSSAVPFAVPIPASQPAPPSVPPKGLPKSSAPQRPAPQSAPPKASQPNGSPFSAGTDSSYKFGIDWQPLPSKPAEPHKPARQEHKVPEGAASQAPAHRPTKPPESPALSKESNEFGAPKPKRGPEPQPPPRQSEPGAPDRARPVAEPEVSSEPPKSNSDAEPVPDTKDLTKQMDEMTKTMVPDWAAQHSFQDLEDLKRERAALMDTIRQTQAKVSSLESTIAQLDGLKNALLGGEIDDLTDACNRVFKRLGWGTQPLNGSRHEILLSTDRPEMIARVIRVNSQAKSSDIAQLAQSVITYWGEFEIEPKGIFVVSTWADRPPTERTDSDFTEASADFAQKKNLCLMTTMQLLSMFRDVELGKESGEEIRRRVMETNGRLQGFALDSFMTRTTAG